MTAVSKSGSKATWMRGYDWLITISSDSTPAEKGIFIIWPTDGASAMRASGESFLHRYGRDITGQFRRLQDGGHIEVMTTAATHGYLPLLHEEGSIQLQIKAGIACYEKYFGRRPRAFWLPECAYRPKCLWASSPAVTGQEVPYPRKRHRGIPC